MTLQVLPGSANLFGGRTMTLRNVPARTAQAMKSPGAPHGLKMACGGNPKRVVGGQEKGRLGAPFGITRSQGTSPRAFTQPFP